MENYRLNDIEEKRAKAFIRWHKRCKKKDESTAPFEFVFTPTGIGVGVDIICPYCHRKKNITDIDSW